MEYTIQKLAQLAKISTRTLRYYDEIDLLNPSRINSSGYRIYGQEEVNRLQQILFYRELGVSLNEIKQILEDPNFDEEIALKQHYQSLLEKKYQLDQLIQTVDLTIKSRQGGIKMSDVQKFEGFKEGLLQENEKKYGKEAREKYGDETVSASYEKFGKLTKEQYDEFMALGEQIIQQLALAVKTQDPKGELALELVKMHRRWLEYTWPKYSKEAHKGLGKMYVADERFTVYYDGPVGTGAAQFLCDAIEFHV